MVRKAATAGRGQPRPLSPHEKRIAGWLARHPGATDPKSKSYDPDWRQHARGHKAREHVERKARETRRYGLTPYQRSVVRKFAAAQARRMKLTDVARVQTIIEKYAIRDPAKFDAWRRQVASMHRAKRQRYRRRVRADGVVVFTGSDAGRAQRLDRMHAYDDDPYFEDMASDLDVDTWELFGYH
jgi:hypothetical protein